MSHRLLVLPTAKFGTTFKKPACRNPLNTDELSTELSTIVLYTLTARDTFDAIRSLRLAHARHAEMTGRLFGRDQKGPQEVSFCPVKPANDQYITEEEYRQRRNAATEAEMGR